VSALKQLLEIVDLLDDPKVDGAQVREFFTNKGLSHMEINVERIEGEKASTDFISIMIQGVEGKYSGGTSRSLGIIGRLGGIGARPECIGLVSDADGAVVSLAAAYKIAEMMKRGDLIEGDVIVKTHICPNAPTRPYKPAPMMDSPVDIFTLLRREAEGQVDAIISVDATKANWVIKHNGFAITPTVKEGWILKVSPDLIDIYIRVTGQPPVVVPITMQDIIPYTTPVYHINSMMQPWIYTKAPIVGVAITTSMVVPGSATGATNIFHLEQATRFVVEVAKDFGRGRVKFYDEEEWKKIISIHGSLADLMRRGAPE
jgi:hypothetical protein